MVFVVPNDTDPDPAQLLIRIRIQGNDTDPGKLYGSGDLDSQHWSELMRNVTARTSWRCWPSRWSRCRSCCPGEYPDTPAGPAPWTSISRYAIKNYSWAYQLAQYDSWVKTKYLKYCRVGVGAGAGWKFRLRLQLKTPAPTGSGNPALTEMFTPLCL